MDSSSWRAACPALVIVVALSLFAGGGVEATPGWVTPTFYSQKLLNLLGRGRAERTFSGDSDVFAQAFQDGSRWRLFLVNRSPQAKEEFRVWIGADQDPPYTALTYTLTGDSGMESSNEDCAAPEVRDPEVSPLGRLTSRIVEVALPAASLVVLEVEAGEPDLVGVLEDFVTGRPVLADTTEVKATLGQNTYTAACDRFGVFRFYDLPTGDYTIESDATGYFPVPETVTGVGQGTPRFVALTAAPSISGRVVTIVDDTPVPVVGAAVWLDGQYNNQYDTVADCNGYFTMPLPAGTSGAVLAGFPTYEEGRCRLVVSDLSESGCFTFRLVVNALTEAVSCQ